MYSDLFLDHFQNPRNVGELPPPAVTVEVSNPACGDLLRISALVEAAKVVSVRYRVRGCSAAIATASALTELMAGRDLAGLRELSTDRIEQAVGGLPQASKHAGVLCFDAVKALVRAQFGKITE